MFANRLMSFSNINVYMTCIFVFQCLNWCPDIFSDFYTSNRNVTDHETLQTCDLHVPVPHGRLDIRRNSLITHGANMWNSIPENNKMSESINVFKQRLRYYLSIRQKQHPLGWGVVTMGYLRPTVGGCRSVIVTTFLLQWQQINNVIYVSQFCRNMTVWIKDYAFIVHVIGLVVMRNVTGRLSLGLLSRGPAMWPGLNGLTEDRAPAGATTSRCPVVDWIVETRIWVAG